MHLQIFINKNIEKGKVFFQSDASSNRWPYQYLAFARTYLSFSSKETSIYFDNISENTHFFAISTISLQLNNISMDSIDSTLEIFRNRNWKKIVSNSAVDCSQVVG